jgi:hypothetical protein
MNAALLSKAVRGQADALLELARDLDGPQARLLRDVAELALVTARLVEGKPLHRAFGAPGDWGYGTPIGDALAAPQPTTEGA